ncbi:hypothetical protein ACTFIR_005760 [Dictyostelium discoideum]
MKRLFLRNSFIFLFTGTNGYGKTTSCSKMAHYMVYEYKKKVLFGASDTFRVNTCALSINALPQIPNHYCRVIFVVGSKSMIHRSRKYRKLNGIYRLHESQ